MTLCLSSSFVFFTCLPSQINLPPQLLILSSQLRHCSRHGLYVLGRWCLRGRCRLGTMIRVAWCTSTSLMAWASSLWSGSHHQPFVTEKKITRNSKLSHRRRQLMILPKISKLVSIERWWLQDLILKAKNKSEETGGNRSKVLRWWS